MEKRIFGKTGLEVSVLGFGASEIGFAEVSLAESERIINAALDSGVNVIDTAECYLASEELIGRAARHRRTEYYLFTKCGHPDGLGTEDWGKSSLLKSIERSLRRLQTDCVDLVLLHSCDEAELRKGEAIEALQQAREKGYTRFIGYSGDDSAASFAVNAGAFDVLETSISIADQQGINRLLPIARERNLGVIAKRPIANAAWRTGTMPVSEYHREYWRRLEALQYDFLREELPHAVGKALRFTLSQPGVHTAIVGTTNPQRYRENVELLTPEAADDATFEFIRKRWDEVAGADWIGQV